MRRIAGIVDGAVSLLLALVVSATILPFAGLWITAALLLLLVFGVWWLVGHIRARPRLLLIYRLAIAGYAAVVVIGMTQAPSSRSAGPVELAGATVTGERARFAAGVASVPFQAVDHQSLAGYGHAPRRLAFPAFAGFGRLGRATQAVMAQRDEAGRARVPMLREPEGESESLGARAVVLRPDGGPPLAFVRLDLVTSDQDIAARIHDRVAPLGFRPETVVVAATHTHASPGGFSRERASEIIGTGHYHPAGAAAIVDAAAGAVEAALAAARPARIGVLRARDRGTDGAPVVARNRRGNRDDIDDRVYGLYFSGRDTGQPIALVINYAFHPTALGARNMRLHRDAAGWLEARLAAAVPGSPPVLFLNGATGDVAIRGKKEATIGKLAEIIAASLPAAGDDHIRYAAVRTTRRLATPAFRAAIGDREHFYLDAGRDAGSGIGRWAGGIAAAPANFLLAAIGLGEIRVHARLDRNAYLGVTASLAQFVKKRPQPFQIALFQVGTDKGESVAMLTVPGEAVTALGRRWRADVERRTGIEDTLIIGLANGSVAYIADRDRLLAGGYEADNTLFGPLMNEDVGEALMVGIDDAARRFALPVAGELDE